MKNIFNKILFKIENILFFLFFILYFLSRLNFQNIFIDFLSQLSFQILILGVLLFVIFIIFNKFLISLITGLVCILFAFQILIPCENCKAFLKDKSKNHYNNIRIMIFNINELNQFDNFNKFVELILIEKPDVIQLQEVSPLNRDKIVLLEKFFPYNIGLNNPKIDIMESIILSKYPLTKTKFNDNLSVVTNLLIDETELLIIGIHLYPPTKQWRYQLLNKQMRHLKTLLKNNSKKVILLGDLNMTASSKRFTNFLKETNLYTYISYKHPTFTWPTFLPIYLGIQFDHVLFSKNFKMTEKKTTDNFKSDHRPLIVDLVF